MRLYRIVAGAARRRRITADALLGGHHRAWAVTYRTQHTVLTSPAVGRAVTFRSDIAPGRRHGGAFLAHGGGQHFRVRYLGRVGQHSEPKCPGVGQRGEGDGDVAGGVRDGITACSGIRSADERMQEQRLRCDVSGA